ncbi:hypothetical protein HNP87_001835 [Methanococcus maripaludis]|uniref:SEC-C motif domain protein n=1 Tax=Methanococcus maripaludis TaxID=39152 RepID=A0A7J9NK24_METMI|nr:SEC-C domain-containing protein [Methanococcus maripaludis]MBA2841286.1 hypothetical protein [Methanococcus maripaludis]
MIIQKYTMIDNGAKKYLEYKLDDFEEIFIEIKSQNYLKAEELAENLKKSFNDAKNEAISKNDEEYANIFYLLDIYVDILNSISKLWQLLDNMDYPTSWGQLQNAIDGIKFLKKYILNPDELQINILENYLENLEKYYPYQLFGSPEYIFKKEECSICGRSPYDPECIHITGRLYMGEVAITLHKDLEDITGFSLVKNPKNKRCILKIKDFKKEEVEKTSYNILHTLIMGLKKPLLNFEGPVIKEGLLPREYFNTYDKNDECPCGSGKKYITCCYRRKYIKQTLYYYIKKEEISLK